MRRLLVVILSVAVCASIVLAASSSTSSSADPPHVLTARVTRGPSPDLGAALVYVGDVERTVAMIREQAAADAFWAWAGDVNRWLASIAPPPVPVSSPSGMVTYPEARSGGGHSDAWWHGVAICEQGGANDPYFGYFSFMDGSMGGQPWDVQVAAGNALLASVGHEVGPWAEKCVNDGYAASPGG